MLGVISNSCVLLPWRIVGMEPENQPTRPPSCHANHHTGVPSHQLFIQCHGIDPPNLEGRVRQGSYENNRRRNQGQNPHFAGDL